MNKCIDILRKRRTPLSLPAGLQKQSLTVRSGAVHRHDAPARICSRSCFATARSSRSEMAAPQSAPSGLIAPPRCTNDSDRRLIKRPVGIVLHRRRNGRYSDAPSSRTQRLTIPLTASLCARVEVETCTPLIVYIRSQER
jgi:hypothetical protein